MVLSSLERAIGVPRSASCTAAYASRSAWTSASSSQVTLTVVVGTLGETDRHTGPPSLVWRAPWPRKGPEHKVRIDEHVDGQAGPNLDRWRLTICWPDRLTLLPTWSA